jgi:hypothetical protein
MSLSLGVDVTHADGARLTAAVGLLLSGSLMLAAIEQFAAEAVTQGWLCLACALACGLWCGIACRRLARKPALRLQIRPDGSIAVAAGGQGGLLPATVAGAWRLGGLMCLRLRRARDPVPPSEKDIFAWRGTVGSDDCLLLLTTESLDGASWHGLRRWLVWHRRSNRRDIAAA